MRRRLVDSALYVAVTAVLGFALAEICLVAFDPQIFRGPHPANPELDMIYDVDMGFRVRPYSGGSNRFGWNGADPPEKDPASFRVLLVGDSFGWVGGREGNYSALLQTLFDDRFGSQRVDVINSGYPGTHTGEQLAMLRKLGFQLEPDLVVLGFFAGNDIVDANPNRKRIVVDGIFLDIDPRHELVLLGRPIVWSSRLLALVRHSLAIRAERAKAQREARALAPSRIEDPWAIQFSEDAFLRIEYDRLQLCDTRALAAGRFADRIDYALANVSRMRDAVSGRGAEFRVAIFPDQAQVDDALLHDMLAAHRRVPQDFEVGCVQHLLRDRLDTEAIPYLDLTDEFRRAGRDRELYLFRNTHWNRAGNELAARLLYDFLGPAVEARLRRLP